MVLDGMVCVVGIVNKGEVTYTRGIVGGNNCIASLIVDCIMGQMGQMGQMLRQKMTDGTDKKKKVGCEKIRWVYLFSYSYSASMEFHSIPVLVLLSGIFLYLET